MPTPHPETLSRLLGARGPEERERAWAELVSENSKLIHSVARRSSADYDTLMDRYTYVLEGLREDDFKRLRTYDPAGSSKFTTWLVVVASRLCVDWHRKTYGRVSSDQHDGEADVRRRLVDLVGEQVGVDGVLDRTGASPEERLQRSELHDALECALGALSSEDRLLLRLRFDDRRPVSEIARTLGLSSEFACYRRLKGTLGALRRDLEGRGVDGPTP